MTNGNQKEQIAMEIYRLLETPEEKDAFRQYAKTKGLDIETIAKAQDIGPLDYLVGTAEIIPMMATGSLAELTSGLGAGVAALRGEDPGEVVERVQRELTYEPKTLAGKDIMRRIGEFVKPIAEPVMKVQSGAADIAAETLGGKVIGPAAGAAIMTLPTAVNEILGLKGSKSAKRIALRRIIKRAEKNVGHLYDELVNLLPSIRKSIDDAGINIKEFEDILPEKIPTKIIERQVEQKARELKDIGGPKIDEESMYKKLAEEVQPSQKVLEAYDEFGFKTLMTPDIVSKNPVFTAIVQGLKSIPGSKLAQREADFVKEISDKANDLIMEFGGYKDKSLMSDLFRDESKNVIAGIKSSEKQLSDIIDKKVVKSDIVDTKNITSTIQEIIDNYGGKINELSPKERRLYKSLSPENKPTYALLDKYRDEIGQALGKNTGPFANQNRYNLGKLYGALAEDQRKAADRYNVGDIYKLRNEMTVQRKTIESQLSEVLGDKLTGDISREAKTALTGLQQGYNKKFDELISKIPEDIDPKTRKAIFATAINDAFSFGAKGAGEFSVAGFDKFWKGISKHKNAYNRLQKELGPETMKRLDIFHTMVGAVNRAQNYRIRTGLIKAVPGMMDELNTITKRAYGLAGMGASMLPGFQKTKAIASMINIPSTKRSVAAEEFLSNPKFIRIIEQKAKGQLETKNKLTQAEKVLENINSYKRWKKTLTEPELRDLATVGAIGYLTNETIKKGEEK